MDSTALSVGFPIIHEAAGEPDPRSGAAIRGALRTASLQQERIEQTRAWAWRESVHSKERIMGRFPRTRTGPPLTRVSVPNLPVGRPNDRFSGRIVGAGWERASRIRVGTVEHECDDSPRESGTDATTVDPSSHVDLLENVSPLAVSYRGWQT